MGGHDLSLIGLRSRLSSAGLRGLRAIFVDLFEWDDPVMKVDVLGSIRTLLLLQDKSCFKSVYKRRMSINFI